MNTKITSDSIEGFNEILEHLKGLPDLISEQVAKAENALAGFTYTIKEPFGIDNPVVYVPNNVRRIQTFDTEIVIYCDGYLLKIVGDMVKRKMNYTFIQPTRNTDGHP